MQVVIYTPFVIRKDRRRRRRYLSLNSPLDRSSILSFWFGMVWYGMVIWYSTYLTKKSTIYIYINIYITRLRSSFGLMGKVQNKYMDKVENVR